MSSAPQRNGALAGGAIAEGSLPCSILPRCACGTDVAPCAPRPPSVEPFNGARGRYGRSPRSARYEPRLQKLGNRKGGRKDENLNSGHMGRLRDRCGADVVRAAGSGQHRANARRLRQRSAVSDADLDTFTTIYVDLLETAEKFEAGDEVGANRGASARRSRSGPKRKASRRSRNTDGHRKSSTASATRSIRDPALGRQGNKAHRTEDLVGWS